MFFGWIGQFIGQFKKCGRVREQWVGGLLYRKVMKYYVDWILSGMENRLCKHERGIRLKERYSQGKISGKLKHRKAIGG